MKKREIPSFIFRKFYDVLCERFYNEFWTSRKELPDKRSRLLWRLKDPKQKTLISSALFRTQSHEYFYRKMLEAESQGVTKVSKETLFHAFSFIGITPPEQHLQIFEDADILAKEKILYNAFLHNYNIKVEQALTISQPDQDLDNVVALIKRFYNHLIGTDALTTAWKSLSDGMRKRRWNDNFEKFVSGYRNFRGHQNLTIFNISQISISIVECLVYYEDHIDAFFSEDLERLSDITVANIEEAVSIVLRIQSRLVEQGVDGFNNIEVRKLFDPVASEYLIYKCDMHDQQLGFFTSKSSIMVRRLYLCTCIFTGEEWAIDGIKTMPYYSVR